MTNSTGRGIPVPDRAALAPALTDVKATFGPRWAAGARTGLLKERKPTRKLVAEFVRIRAAGSRNVGSLTTSATNPFFRPWAAATGALEKTVLIRQVVSDAKKTDDAARRYVLLPVAKDMAVQAGEIDAAYDAVDCMAESLPNQSRVLVPPGGELASAH